MQLSKGRLQYLDAMRGSAAVAVAIFHYVHEQVQQGTLHGFEAAVGNAISVHFDLGKAAVVLFFLISGYIIPHSLGPTRDRIGRFTLTRFFRLYPLYWLVLIAGVFLPWPVSETFTASDILANVTMVQGFLGHKHVVNAFWTLQIELVFYFCCIVAAFFNRMRSPGTCFAISSGLLGLALVLSIGRNLLVKPLPVALPLALSVMFLGTLWRQATIEQDSAAKRLVPWLVGIVSLMIVPISMIGYNRDFGHNEHWQSYVSCYETALLVFLLFTTKIKVRWAPLVWLGQISYSIYLIHPLVASAAIQSGMAAKLIRIDPFLYCCALLVIVILAAGLAYRLVEQPSVSIGHYFAGRMKARTSLRAEMRFAVKQSISVETR